jgi:hypothetical protein
MIFQKTHQEFYAIIELILKNEDKGKDEDHETEIS